MVVHCPHCGSRNVRKSGSQTFPEKIAAFFGYFQIRCRDCDHRFSSVIWDLRNVFYSRCPRCYRLDLSSWNPDNYHISTSRRFLLMIGGKRRRCDACRCNFISFRMKRKPGKDRRMQVQARPLTDES